MRKRVRNTVSLKRRKEICPGGDLSVVLAVTLYTCKLALNIFLFPADVWLQIQNTDMQSIESLLAYLSACTCDTDPHRELHVARAILVWIAVMRGRSSIPGLPPDVTSLARGDPPAVFQKLCEYNLNLIHFPSINLTPYKTYYLLTVLIKIPRVQSLATFIY